MPAHQMNTDKLLVTQQRPPYLCNSYKFKPHILQRKASYYTRQIAFTQVLFIFFGK